MLNMIIKKHYIKFVSSQELEIVPLINVTYINVFLNCKQQELLQTAVLLRDNSWTKTHRWKMPGSRRALAWSSLRCQDLPETWVLRTVRWQHSRNCSQTGLSVAPLKLSGDCLNGTKTADNWAITTWTAAIVRLAWVSPLIWIAIGIIWYYLG